MSWLQSLCLQSLLEAPGASYHWDPFSTCAYGSIKWWGHGSNPGACNHCEKLQCIMALGSSSQHAYGSVKWWGAGSNPGGRVTDDEKIHFWPCISGRSFYASCLWDLFSTWASGGTVTNVFFHDPLPCCAHVWMRTSSSNTRKNNGNQYSTPQVTGWGGL